MEYIVLTETDFFRQIDEDCNHNELCPAYKDFTDKVIQLCLGQIDHHRIVLALTYAETELQFHDKLNKPETDEVPVMYIRKALALSARFKNI